MQSATRVLFQSRDSTAHYFIVTPVTSYRIYKIQNCCNLLTLDNGGISNHYYHILDNPTLLYLSINYFLFCTAIPDEIRFI